MRHTRSRCGVTLLACLLAAAASGAGVAPETVSTTQLGPAAPTWFVVKAGLGAGYVFDAADGEMIGTLSLTPWTPTVRRHAGRGEIYAAETHYSRRHDGERTDVLRIYAHETLSPVGEIAIPNKIAALHRHYLGVLSGGRFVTVFNMTPAQSVSVVDVENRRFVGEISTAGCAVTLPTGDRGFLMMCGDGTLQWIGLDEDGTESARVRSAPFFSVEDDPLFDDPTPTPAGWQFLSFAGVTMEAVVENGEIVIGKSWSILGKDDEGWRPGGGQPATFHAGNDLLVVLMHQGGVDTQDQDGTEAWVLDRSTQRRIGRITFEAPASALLVVEDNEPALLAAIGGSVHVFDLATGVRQRVVQTNQGGSLLRY
ncbi:MAG: amine dehydrogenase large subunit [Gammaproteobacteria bacterium]|nr:amine dehydrogenase large subunit [Gammaproteobacteria bacterium]